MDKSFRQQGSDSPLPSGLLVSLQFLNGILIWLAGLFRLTEEEKNEAGVRLGDQRYK